MQPATGTNPKIVSVVLGHVLGHKDVAITLRGASTKVSAAAPDEPALWRDVEPGSAPADACTGTRGAWAVDGHR